MEFDSACDVAGVPAGFAHRNNERKLETREPW